MYLELAENPYAYMSEQATSGIDLKTLYEYYVPIENEQGQIEWIREDYFDDMPDMQFERAMAESAYTAVQLAENGQADPELLSSIFGIGKKARERRRQRREQRRERRQQRKDMRMQRKEARTQRQISGQTGFNRLIGTVGDIFKKPEVTQIEPSRDTQALEFTYSDLPEGAGAEKEKKMWYHNPLVIVGGVVVLGLGIWAATRRK